jgi:hypothetical protein
MEKAEVRGKEEEVRHEGGELIEEKTASKKKNEKEGGSNEGE